MHATEQQSLECGIRKPVQTYVKAMHFYHRSSPHFVSDISSLHVSNI